MKFFRKGQRKSGIQLRMGKSLYRNRIFTAPIDPNPMKKFSLFLLAFSAIEAASAQSHQFALGASYHYYEDDFYVSNFEPSENTSVELAGNGKFSLGLEYNYLFNEINSWLVSGRLDYSYRSYTTTVLDTRDFVPSYNLDHHAQYLDLMLGGGRQFSLNDQVIIGTRLLPGIGIPLQKATDTTITPILPPYINVDRFLSFIELDVYAQLLYSQKENHAWSIGISPFVRTYFSALYEDADTENQFPYWSFGASVRLGLEL